MARRAKLAPGSLLTVDDQIRLYEEATSKAAAKRQVKLADEKAGRCTCRPRTVKRHWGGSEKVTGRRVHDRDCGRWKTWMAEVDL